MLDKKEHSTLMLNLKFVRYSAALDVIISSLETVIFNPKEMLCILDLRSVGYYKIKQDILHQNLSKYYRFESAGVLCEQLNNL